MKIIKNASNAMKKKMHLYLSLIAVMFVSVSATAATAPTSTATLGYQIYDLIFNDIYGTGGGYAAGVLMFLWAFTKFKQDWREAAWIGAGATGVLTIPAIATALGATVI